MLYDKIRNALEGDKMQDMMDKYNDYLSEHIGNNIKAFEWLCENTDIIDSFNYDSLYEQIKAHDSSKYNDNEYYPYLNFFYGDDKDPNVKEAFDRAWLSHIHNNPHHWQYWILHNDDEELGINIIKMHESNVIEMVCDWMSFGIKTNNLYELFNFYESKKDYIKLHPDTRKYLEDILVTIKEKLDNGATV